VVQALFLTSLIGGVSLLYATAGQAGGTAFLAVMTFAAFPATQMRPTALLLNVVAAGYATWRLHHKAAIERKLLLQVTILTNHGLRWRPDCAGRARIFRADRNPAATCRRPADLQALGRYT
jgi:hypothetical protein